MNWRIKSNEKSLFSESLLVEEVRKPLSAGHQVIVFFFFLNTKTQQFNREKNKN